MRCAPLAAAIGGLALAAGSAAGAQSTITVSLTNDTAVSWQAVRIEIRPPLAVPFDPVAYEQVKFVDNMALHFSTKAGAAVHLLDAPTNKQLEFDFSGATPIAPGDFPIDFTFRIDNPSSLVFRIGTVTVPVPGPSSAGALLLAGVCVSGRRRR